MMRRSCGFLLVVLAACDPSGPQAEAEGAVCADTGDLTWETFGQPFFLNWCTGCHGSGMGEYDRQEAPLDVNFDSYEGVVERLDDIAAYAADGNALMPPAGGPSEEERLQLGEWIRCGAP